MGLPHGATVRAVTGTPDDDLDEEFVSDGGRRKRRTNRCKEGHDFYVYFEF